MNTTLTNEEGKMLVNDTIKRIDSASPQIGTTNVAPTNEFKLTEVTDSETKLRKLLIIGTGDGGCNIASMAKRHYPDYTRVVLYNTSARALGNLTGDSKLTPNDGYDGAGKERGYSKDAFKRVHRQFIEKVDEYKDFCDYIVVVSTCDGGTGGGISPMVAKLMSGIKPTILVGVYPSLDEDAHSQKNLIDWQAEAEKSEARYMVFDNNKYRKEPKSDMHRKVNDEVVAAIGELIGSNFGITDIQAIDNRDFKLLMDKRAGRIAVYTTNKPKSSDSVDDNLESLISQSSQILPSSVQLYGLFIKGSNNIISTSDIKLNDIRAKYGEGDMFNHIEIADDSRITLICSGCDVATERLQQAASRYKEIMESRTKRNTFDFDAFNLDGYEDDYDDSRQSIDLNALAL